MTIQSLSKIFLLALALSAFKVQAQSSIEYRKNQHAAVYISPLVISDRTFALLPRIYGGRYYINEKYQVDLFDKQTDSGGGQFESRQISLNLQYFFGNSLYVKAGIETERLKWDMVYSYQVGYDRYDGAQVYARIQTIGLNGAIGQEWQFEKSFFGIEYFEFYNPTSVNSCKIERYGRAGGSDAEYCKQAGKEALKGGGFLPKFDFGISF